MTRRAAFTMLLSAVLTGLSTVRVDAHFSIPARADGLNLTLEVVALDIPEGEEGDVRLTVGSHRFRLYVLDEGYRPVDGADIKLTFHPPSTELGAQQILTPEGQGAYRAEGAFLSRPGAWRVAAVIRLPGRTEPIVADFELDVAPAPSAGIPLSLWAAVGLLLVLGGIGVIALRVRRRRHG